MITAKAGDKIVIEKGVPHTFKNATNDFVLVNNAHEPGYGI